MLFRNTRSSVVRLALILALLSGALGATNVRAAPLSEGDATTVLVVSTSGTPLAGKSVYAFNGTAYTGYSKVTDANGEAVFSLPEGSYRFRVDVDGTQFWSGTENHCSNCLNVTVTIPEPVLVTVQDTDGTPAGGLNVYAFNGTTYTGFHGTSNQDGQVTLRLREGAYRFRADLNGTQFWSGTVNHCDVPGCENASVTVTRPMTVTVLDTNGTPKSGLNVYAFTGSTYTGYNKITNADGQTVFTLPLGSYRFRADLNGTQFWSGAANHCDIPGCESASVTVTQPMTVTVLDTDGTPKSGLNVYAFNGSTYTGYNKVTSADGQAVFTLPLGSYRFRADLNGTQFWSGAANHCNMPGCESASVTVTIPITVAIQDGGGVPKSGVSVYAFNGSTYTGYNKVSDANGQTVFTLPLGSYRFRADYSGVQYWSNPVNHCTLPGCAGASVTVGPAMTATSTSTPLPTYTPTPTQPPAMSIQIVQPNGGETLTVGTTYRITWNSTPNIDTVSIGYKACDSCLDWIAFTAPNVGYYDWEVSVGNTVNTQFRIEITGYDTGVGSTADISDNYFTVLPPPATDTPIPTYTPTATYTSSPTSIPTTRVVTNTNNSGTGSLRQAVLDANSGDRITFAPSLAGQTITLLSNLTINKSLTIDGSELSPQVIISGGNDAHIVISYSSVVTIFRVTITNCYGGAINSMGDLTLINTTLRDNVSSSAGGALISEGTLTILDSTIYHNQAGGGGALMVNGTSEVNIVNSTITQNQAGIGGAIYANGGAEIQIFNSTIAGNTGGELFVNGNVTLRLYNTALVCTAGDDCYFFNGGSWPVLVNSPLNIGTLAEYGLGELADNGGPTWTMALLPGSPLIDAGDDASCLTADQRRVSRPQGAHCDIGAYEYEEENLVPTTTTIITSPNPSISGTSVNIHVTVTGNDGTPTGSVTVTSGAGNCNIILSNGQGSCAMAFSDPGTFTIAAHYNGDNQYLTSDGTVSHTVMAAPPTSTYTPSPTATFTPSPTATFTVTPGPTPVAGCSSIRDGVGAIRFSGKTMYLDIPNSNPYPVTVSSVYVAWNYAAGHTPGDSSLYLQKAQLGATVFWTGNLNQPSAFLPLSTAVTVPASSTARITFTFDKIYNRQMGNEQIQIQFSTPGCEAYPVIVPAGSPVVTPLP